MKSSVKSDPPTSGAMAQLIRSFRCSSSYSRRGDGQGKEAWVTFGEPGVWLLTVGIHIENRKGLWDFIRVQEDTYESGFGFEWRNGRLTKDRSKGAPRFYQLMKENGLDFGDFEAELRQLTGYVENKNEAMP